ncbi:MAG: hypothetical protein Q7S19_01820 [bacterium]|nr:hypothetical protein [bacterium]
MAEPKHRPLIFDSYQGVNVYFSKNDECARLGRYMKVFRVNYTLDSHVFMAVNMLAGRPINIPYAAVRKNKCTEADETEIHSIEFFWFDDGDPEDDGYDEELKKFEESKPSIPEMVIN